MPRGIEYGLFSTSELSPQELINYQYLLNGEELYGSY